MTFPFGKSFGRYYPAGFLHPPETSRPYDLTFETGQL